MNNRQLKLEFEKNKRVYESTLLTFKGVDGWDVYNCSVPFTWEGKRYIFGRVERRDEWANSHVRLFEETGKDEWTVVADALHYPLEDPYISEVHGELTMGGTHVRKTSGEIDTYYGYFYRGNPSEMLYFTTGPDYMKDIRLVDLENGKIGVFSRPRGETYKGGAKSMIGYTTINSLDELTADVIENAPYIDGIFDEGEWGGVNQAILLKDGLIGCITHMCYEDTGEDGRYLQVYTNATFVFDPESFTIKDFKIIGTRSCYPEAPAKKPDLIDCTFTSGIEFREDGKVDLYAGVGDVYQGRITIDNPFEGYIK